MLFGGFIYRHRLAGKRAVAFLSRLLPARASRYLRALAERVAFNLTPQYQGDTLPPVFHYWSNRYLAPEARRLGIVTPEALYLKHIVERAAKITEPVRVLSAGSGAASMEIKLAEELKAADVPAHIVCLDFNPDLTRKGAIAAQERGVARLLTFEILDCNQSFEADLQDVIIVNQFFHHIFELEKFCGSLRRSLATHGVILTSDVIGRNGHQLWPDVETEVQSFWATLSPAHRYDRYFGSVQKQYRQIDHAAYSNEGIRSQDVISCLLTVFDFEVFLSFGAAIIPFIERRIGFNFNPDRAQDRELINRIQAIDVEALAAGRYPASNMIAVLRHKSCGLAPAYIPISPQRHIELTRAQQAKVRSSQ